MEGDTRLRKALAEAKRVEPDICKANAKRSRTNQN
ncbi:hypothetical protein F-liban_330 [Faustovirus]|nr:hypothetical protein F-liban_330 [Faustovirus]